MYICFLPLLIVLLPLLHIAIATPYFRPYLETRQSPTLGSVANLIYPANNDASTCPNNPTNLLNGDSFIAANPSKRKRRRNIYNNFNVPVANPRGQHAKRALQNGTCQTVARLSFSDWEASYGVNTPPILLPGGYTYTFSIAANVNVDDIQCWTKKANSDDFQKLNEVKPSKTMNATLQTDIKSTTEVHWYIHFQYGHPRGSLAVFSNQAPKLNQNQQWADGSALPTTAKAKLKPKKRRRRRDEEKSWWSWGFGGR